MCVRLCLGFKELYFGKAAMEEEVEDVPFVFTNTDAICFVPLVIMSSFMWPQWILLEV